MLSRSFHLTGIDTEAETDGLAEREVEGIKLAALMVSRNSSLSLNLNKADLHDIELKYKK